jgi:hypothetical protein
VPIPADRLTQQKVYGWAYRLLQNHDDALDAAQEVMLRGVPPWRAGHSSPLGLAAACDDQPLPGYSAAAPPHGDPA